MIWIEFLFAYRHTFPRAQSGYSHEFPGHEFPGHAILVDYTGTGKEMRTTVDTLQGCMAACYLGFSILDQERNWERSGGTPHYWQARNYL